LAHIELFLIFREKTPPENGSTRPEGEKLRFVSLPVERFRKKHKKHFHLVFVLRK